MNRSVLLYIVIALASSLLSGCGNREVRQTIREVEAILDERPEEALTTLDTIDSTSLRFKPLRMRHDLLYAIVLDKNHIDDGRYVQEMTDVTEWYERFGNKTNKLKSRYYYGDQLRGAGRFEEAAVQFMRSEKEAIRQKDWFLAGMSARSLYYLFSKTYNYPEELSSISRAVEYFNLAKKEVHEYDAKLKLAMAYYDNHEIGKSDSLFNEVIQISIDNRDTTRWSRALVESVNGMLIDKPFNPDSATIRIIRSIQLGRKPSSRTLSNLALSESLMGNTNESEMYLSEAYRTAINPAQLYANKYRDYQIRINRNDTDSAFCLLQQIYSYTDSVAIKSLEQSVVSAQNRFLATTNEKIEHDYRVSKSLLILSLLLAISVLVSIIITIKRVTERNRAEKENHYREFDDYRHASRELMDLGLRGIGHISEAYYVSGNNKAEATLNAYKSMVSGIWSNRDTRAEFVEKVDRANGNVITKLREQIPSLSEAQVMLFAYIVCGFSYTTTSVIMGDHSKQYVYTRKKRLVDTIRKKSPKDKELFLSYLVR